MLPQWKTIPTSIGRDTPDPAPLDRILGSRSHVRILRALVTKDPGENVGVRDVARMSRVSHPRAAQVLRELDRSGLVDGHKTRWGTVYELNDDHFLAPRLWTLFDEELHVLQGIHGFVRGEVLKSRRAVRVRLELGIDRPLEVVLASAQPFGMEDQRWFEELEEEIRRRFGLDVRVAAQAQGEWLAMLD